MTDFSHLKPGDKVFIKTWPSNIYSLLTVDKITPKGYIRTKHYLFDTDGREKTTEKWHRHTLIEYSDETFKTYTMQQKAIAVQDYFQRTMVSKLSDDVLDKFYAIIKELK